VTIRVVFVRSAWNVLFTGNIQYCNSVQAISINRSVCQTRYATETEWHKRTYVTDYGTIEFPEIHSHWNSWTYFPPWCNSPDWAMASLLSRLHDHNHTTLSRTPLDEWSARRRDNHLTTRNTTDIHAPGGIQTPNPSKRAAADIFLRLRGYCDRHSWTLHRWRYGSVGMCRH